MASGTAASMSRSAPPASIAESWRGSPIQRIVAPRSARNRSRRRRLRLPSLTCSSTITSVSVPMSRTHCGNDGGNSRSRCELFGPGVCRLRTSRTLSTVSTRWLIDSPSTAAADAVGASPRTWPPLAVHASASTAIAVVLPDPAGALVVRTRRFDAAKPSITLTCPALRGRSG